MIKNLQRGVTLFELVLVMLIIALMTVAAIRYADRERDEAAGDRLAQKLYTFGQAVREYVFDHQFEIGSGTIDLEYEGVAWLLPDTAGYNETGEPYLREDFTFTEGLDPLFLGQYDGSAGTPANTDDEIVYTTFFWNVDEGRFEASIDIGSLYDPNTGVADNGKPNPPQVMPDITAKAAQLASSFYDPIKGFAAMSYSIDLTDPSFPNIPVTGTLAYSAPTSEMYLRTDGQNYMQGYLDFIDADTHGGVSEDEDNFGIRYIETIDFDQNASTVTQINNLDQLNFKAPSAQSGSSSINGVMDIRMGSIAISRGSSDHIATDTPLFGQTSYRGIPYYGLTGYRRDGGIHFTDGMLLNTLQVLTCSPGSGGKYFLTYRHNNTSSSQHLSACYVTEDWDRMNCRIGRSTGLNPVQYYIANAQSRCSFTCLVWDTRALTPSFCNDQVSGGYRDLPY